jgi:diguanylate cyclase (GGDEF)-like protein
MGMRFDDVHMARRQAIIEALDLVGGPTGPEFDALAALAAQLTDAPIAAFTLIDQDTQHMLASVGIEPAEMRREQSFCDHTIRQRQMLVVPDALRDSRFASIPMVTDDPHVRFYAGVPVEAQYGGDRAAIGAVCIVDHRPRALTDRQRAALENIGRVTESLLEARHTARHALRLAEQANEQAVALARQDRIFGQAERLAMIGSWRYDLASATITWSDGVRRIHEVGPAYGPTLANALDFYPPAARATVSDALARAAENGEPFDFETDFITARGRLLRVRCRGEAEREDGSVTELYGVFQDVTARWLMEQQLRRSAHIDALTGIANRAGFDERIAAAMTRAQTGGTPLALVLIDLDAFKTVNDTHGHVVGDDVLRAYGLRLRADWLSDVFPARMGGDEFALIVEGPATHHLLQRIDRLLTHLAKPIATESFVLDVPGTIGWARFDPGMGNVRDLIHAADTALYEAKRARRGSAHAACA